MNKSWFEIVKDIWSYIFDLRIVDIPYHIALCAVSVLFGYTAAMILIGFPVSVWEHFTKKKARADIEGKVITVVAVCLSIAFIIRVLYEKIT